MALTTFQQAMSTTPFQVSSGNIALRALYLTNISTLGLPIYINASSSGTSTTGFPLEATDPPYRLDGAAATDVLWAMSTAAASAILAGYKR